MITSINEFKKILENTTNVFDANFIIDYIIFIYQYNIVYLSTFY